MDNITIKTNYLDIEKGRHEHQEDTRMVNFGHEDSTTVNFTLKRTH